MAQQIHSGHRDRLKQRFLQQGLDGFTDIQALELLLFYSIPRQDTNPIAHRLLDHFGSLSQVLEASAEELMRIGGINQRQAQIIQMLMDEPNAMLTVKDLCVKLLVSPTTAKADLAGLMQLGIVDEIALNKVKRGYIRSKSFARAIQLLT